jgi:hypothetical protein
MAGRSDEGSAGSALGERNKLVLDQDELVAPQGFDRFEVDLGEWARGLGNQSQGLRPPLSERAFERALLAQRLEPLAA